MRNRWTPSATHTHQLLFAANQARRDIQTSVSFQATQVQAPAEDDWGKLKRVLKYLNGTRHLKLTLCAEQLKFAVHWYVGGSHQIHKDCHAKLEVCLLLDKEQSQAHLTK